MSFEWIHENPARWDDEKKRIVGTSEVFDFGSYEVGDLLPGDWWRVEKGGKVVGYGWMDATWGDAEVLLAVAKGERKSGVGTFVMDRLANEAHARGLNHLYNVIPEGHPEPEVLRAWLLKRHFHPSEDGKVLKRLAAAH
jgi:N-acetylglutamate synthase-like GNAT family acetyltransferase